MTIKTENGTLQSKTTVMSSMTDVTPDDFKVYRYDGTGMLYRHFTAPGVHGSANIDQQRQLAFTPGGLYSKSEIDKYFPPIVVDSVTVAATGAAPTALPAAGGTVLRVRGQNLTGVTAISFEGGASGTSLTINSENELLVTTPAKTAGTYDMVFTDDSGQLTLTDVVTFV